MGLILPAYINVNRNGIPALKSNSVVVTSTEVQYDFNDHRNVGLPFRGILVINLAQSIPTGVTSTLPVVFTTNGSQPKSLVTYDNANVTVADITGTGIYLVWYDDQSDYLQLL